MHYSHFTVTVTVLWQNRSMVLRKCRYCLGGTAQAFVRSKDDLNSWPMLRDRLFSEFLSGLTTADVHRLLSTDGKR